jgi:signal transduction histidine kinase
MTALHRHRLVVYWSLFAVAAGAAALAFHHLYATARDEIAAQAQRAVALEQARACERIEAYTEQVRRITVSELAAFHVDGLGHALRRWDGANELVVRIFLWEPGRGFLPGFEPLPSGPAAADLPQLWLGFRAWRAAHPEAERSEPARLDGLSTAAYRTLDNPVFPDTALGYQGENLDILAHAGRAVDPWAGWAGNEADPAAPWVFWYQPGPDAPVRGCLVEVAPLVRRLREELGGNGAVRLTLAGAPAAGTDGKLAGLPAHRLSVEPGDAFRAKAGDTRLAGGVGALLLGLFLGAGALLTVLTRRSAREAERRISFVAQVSHELRTPLTSIRMFADLLSAPGLDEAKRTRFAGRISDESRRLAALIERLLAFNALEKGVRRVECGPVDVAGVVQEVAEEMRATLAAAGLVLEIVAPAGVPAALSERSTIKQALINLLDNSAKYAPGSGAVAVALRADAALLRLTVADRGPGIPPELRARVFEPFVQGGRTLTDKSPGVGLGLSIARGLLRQTGGDLVLVHSSSGAAFEMRLPLAQPQASVSST